MVLFIHNFQVVSVFPFLIFFLISNHWKDHTNSKRNHGHPNLRDLQVCTSDARQHSNPLQKFPQFYSNPLSDISFKVFLEINLSEDLHKPWATTAYSQAQHCLNY